MVISQKMILSITIVPVGGPNRKGEIGNRGSKSVSGLYKPTSFKHGAVKEQRVDDSW
jgi:hypothetical protein